MLKGILTYIGLCIFSLSVLAQKASITESAGWLESAFVKWQMVDGAESYNVYYSGQGKTDQKIDDQLIRKYQDYYRADVLGLEAGTYTLKVVPVVNGEEGEASVTESLTVESHDRTGFAFSNNRVPGAYNDNGTPRNGAVVLYITENSKNSIELEVTGANSNPCVGLQTILEGFKKGNDNRPLIIRLVGQITDLDVMDKGDIVIENDNNSSGFITFEGVGDDAVADGWGIRVKNASNIEIRNIGLMNTNSEEGDDIGLQQNNDHIWVHHCDFFYGDAGGDSDQAKGDGALDCKKSTYVTFSYNHFWDTGKSNLLGLSEDTTKGLFITYHHNWYDHCDSRHPRVRFYSAHVYNNYYDGIAKYGVGSTLGSSVFVEANYFRNCKYPILTSMQGSDVFDESSQTNDYSDMPTFSKEDGGSIKAFNNYMTGQKRFVPYGDSNYPNSTVDFDAYVASSRDEVVSTTVKSAFGSNTYNNFDTNTSVMYNYTADSPEAAKTKVMAYAGRMNGGDFKWTFNNTVDDALYSLNSGLKTSLVNYTTGLIEVQADSADTGGGNGGSDGGGSEIKGDVVHNFTESGTTSTYFDISGNLSDSKGTVVFNDLTLTQCLKIESSTSIKFTTSEEASLTLVFNPTFAGRINVDGMNYKASEGIVTLTIAAGEHEITKTDVANLYYINIDFIETGTAKINISSGLKVYPNPVTHKLNIITADEIEHVVVYNMSGARVVLDQSGAKTIDLSLLNTGSYILEVIANGQYSKQLILKK
ncbi:T9SS type A sorting domain-containing protein [uncultured Draconibacterium sp.]|uniref:pectate lyase family protein n=1 Tax=uncultured Draconibacterium sp. TaxID=1573823 RepID=UPI003216A417